MKKRTFTVDAALLQELGERLIGRAHIALAELIKNAYDADAMNCRIRFEDDRIVIADDGHGMSQQEFLERWMRVGTTHKADQKQSRLLGRGLTGSKGIGRLSAQFLASELTLESTSVDQPDETLFAVVDWSTISRGQDLDTVQVEWEMRADAPEYPCGSRSGTQIALGGLKSEWDAKLLEDLGRDVWSLRSPFGPTRRTGGNGSAGDFYVDVDAPEIEGARAAFDKMKTNLFANAKARIQGTLDRGRSGTRASVSVELVAGYPEGIEEASRFNEAVVLPVSGDDGLSPFVDRAQFDILVFRTEGKQGHGISVGDMRDYLGKFGNVSVYDAGFRLPYYGSAGDKTGQDWLNIALDQGRRLNISELLPEKLRTQNRYMQDLPAPGRIFGAVDIDTNHERTVAERAGASPGEWLQIQSSRDRLHSNDAFFQLRDLVRFSLDLYANRYRMLALQAAEERQQKEPASRKFAEALKVLDQGKSDIRPAVYRAVRKEIVEARKAVQSEEKALDQRAVLLAPLASAGMTALALNHELAREGQLLESSSEKLSRLADRHSLPELEEIARSLSESHERLGALQELFAPLLSGSDAAATERLRVDAIVKHVVRSMRPLLPRVRFDMKNVPRSLRFPEGSFAEWSAILQNVVANAWNAMLDSPVKEIAFVGERGESGRERLQVCDTGVGLGATLKDSAKLFEPFERMLEIKEENRSVAIGGHGLGLSIARMIASRRAARVRFVQPRERFSTTFEISWRGAR